jgi:hypothetical protein
LGAGRVQTGGGEGRRRRRSRRPGPPPPALYQMFDEQIENPNRYRLSQHMGGPIRRCRAPPSFDLCKHNARGGPAARVLAAGWAYAVHAAKSRADGAPCHHHVSAPRGHPRIARKPLTKAGLSARRGRRSRPGPDESAARIHGGKSQVSPPPPETSENWCSIRAARSARGRPCTWPNTRGPGARASR